MAKAAFTRRGLFGVAMATASTAAIGPAWASAAGFTHGVASGDPTQGSVILWTRYVPASRGAARLRYEVAADEGFTRILRTGQVRTGPETDYCAKVDVTALEPDARYFYRFSADGAVSPTGRTRTLPARGHKPLRLALFSCSHILFGHFGAYGHAAADDSLDIALHVGDYIYEYERGVYPSLREIPEGRSDDPLHEIVSLADYRARYASYRKDLDLQAVHAALPFICVWDDHELTNDAWRNGAQNHQSETEGPWPARRRAAVRAYHEWLPTRPGAQNDRIYRDFRWGDLASLIMLDTRLIGRDEGLDFRRDIIMPKDADAATQKAVIDTFKQRLADPARTLLGRRQERWFNAALERSRRQDDSWQIIGQQILAGFLRMPPESPQFVSADMPRWMRERADAAVRYSAAGLPFNMDSWGGYPAARQRLLDAIAQRGGNTLVLAGDSHNAWAFELPGGADGQPLAAEIGTHSVTSSGFEASISVAPAIVADAMVRANPELKWCDVSQRGYTVIDVSKERARTEWRFLRTVKERSTDLAGTRVGIVEARPGAGVSPWSWES